MISNHPEYAKLLHPKVLQNLDQRGFEEFYPPQRESIFAGIHGKNLVVSIPTASGKTLIAEVLAMQKYFTLQDAGTKAKIIYLTPLKALAQEKFHEFKQSWGKMGVKVGLSIGDPDIPDYTIFTNDCMILTNEKADSLLRMNPKLLQDVKIIISDEIHLINDDTRGITLEFLLTKIRTRNPEIQIIGLSATIANAQELAVWLDAELITSEWRPVALKEGYYLADQIIFKDQSVRKVYTPTSSEPVITITLDMLKEGGQVLVFVNSRPNAVNVAKKLLIPVKLLLSPKEREELSSIQQEFDKLGDLSIELTKTLSYCIAHGVAFHHAGLSANQLDFIVTQFNAHKIKVICATPTLAAGVNTPARRVIIHSLFRYSAEKGNTLIPVIEYKQMAGRAGRPRYDPYGEVVILSSDPKKVEDLANKYIHGEPEQISSKLQDQNLLKNHILGLIASKDAKDFEALLRFLFNSLYMTQLIYKESMGGISTIAPSNRLFKKNSEFSQSQLKKTGKRGGKGVDPLHLSNKIEGFQTADKIITPEEVALGLQQHTSSKEALPQASEKKIQAAKMKIQQLLEETLIFLEEEQFITRLENKDIKLAPLESTEFGKVTIRSYLDVRDAIIFRDDLKYAALLVDHKEIELTAFSWLHLIAKANGFIKIPVKNKEKNILIPFIEGQTSQYIMEEVWGPASYEFEKFAEEVKVAWILLEWIKETPEPDIVDNFEIGQGDLHRCVENAQWLLRALQHINRVLGLERFNASLNAVYQRILYGIKAELLEIVQLRGIGRVRARQLYQAGFKTLEQIKTTTPERLASTPGIGLDLAKKLQAQLIESIEDNSRIKGNISKKISIVQKKNKAKKSQANPQFLDQTNLPKTNSENLALGEKTEPDVLAEKKKSSSNLDQFLIPSSPRSTSKKAKKSDK